jgi:hypothetical protein
MDSAHLLQVKSPNQASSAAERGDGDLDETMDFCRALRDLEDPVHETDRGRFQTGSEDTEIIPESTASYLNRKTSLLMLYFPLA